MKKLLSLGIFLLISILSFSQNPIKFRWSSSVNEQAVDSVKLNSNGTNLKKGDTFVMYLSAAGNGNTTTRQILLDFQFQNTALQLISINNTGTGGNGGILSQGSNAQESYYEYVGYSYSPTNQNTTSNGTVNYQSANYNYTSGGSNSIVRYNLTWSGTKGMPYNTYSGLLKLTFKVKSTMTGFNMDPVKLNFVAAWTGKGAYDVTLQEEPLKETIYLNPNADSYVNANIDINANITAVSPMKVLFYDTLGKIGNLFDITSTGVVNVDQTKLKANTVYKVYAMVNIDKLNQIQNAAVTISDFTIAQNEFVKTNLDGTPANINMTTGASYLSADMNSDKVFNGGDLPILLASVVGLDTLLKTPTGYQAGSGEYMSVWTFNDTTFNKMTNTNWKDINDYGVYFKTGKIGDYLPLNLKYLLWGDINRSHSSQVINASGTIVSSAIPSLAKSGIVSNSITSMAFINTTHDISSINVSLNNTTVTSNNVEIPINVDTKGSNISALQFQFEYDATKIKFEELASILPNTWYVFASSKEGKVKFGCLSQNLKESIYGNSIPFKLKFSTIGNGVDIITSVKVSSVMDASDSNGNQIGINLNTTTIKLIGYNNF